MKKLIATFTLALFAVVSFAQTKTTAPVIEFEKEVHDYGTIQQNGDGSYDFLFTNTGKEPLVISNCKGSCGCTVPSWPNEPIAPGATGVIKVKYDTKRLGQFQKSVTITSNSETPTKVIKIKGNVVAPQGNNLERGATGAPVAKP